MGATSRANVTGESACERIAAPAAACQQITTTTRGQTRLSIALDTPARLAAVYASLRLTRAWPGRIFGPVQWRAFAVEGSCAGWRPDWCWPWYSERRCRAR